MDYEYWVYMVSSLSGTLYIGMTKNIYGRALEHKSGEFEGFASKYGCNRLVYDQGFDEVLKVDSATRRIREELVRSG